MLNRRLVPGEVFDGVGVSLLGEEAPAVLSEVFVDGVRRDDRVEGGRERVFFWP